MIDLKHRIVFIHIPKTGGTAMNRYFMDIRDLKPKDAAAIGVFRNHRDSSLERANSHNTLAMYERFYFGGPVPDDFTIFTVVRHPLDRYWSEFRYRRFPGRKKFPVGLRLPLGWFERLASAEIDYLKDFNCHLRPQAGFVSGASADRVRVLKYETLADDFDAFRREHDLPVTKLAKLNVSRRAGSTPPERVREVVRRRYAEDFERFDYSMVP